MNKSLLPIFFVFGFIFSVKAQLTYPTPYKITYSVIYHPDTTRPQVTDSTQLYLYSGKDYGVSVSGLQSQGENLKTQVMQLYHLSGEAEMNMMGYVGPFNQTFYKNFKKDSLQVIGNLSGKNFRYSLPAKKLGWELIDSTKNIAGYTAQKAKASFGGRDYTAWFSPGIPLPDGPLFFHGLPGLIIDLKDTEGDYHFRMIQLKKLKSPKIFSIPKTKRVTRKEYRVLADKSKKNRHTSKVIGVLKVAETGQRIPITDQTRNQTRNAERKFNNPIIRE